MQLSQRNIGILAIVSAIVVPVLTILLVTMAMLVALLPRVRFRLPEDGRGRDYRPMLAGNPARE